MSTREPRGPYSKGIAQRERIIDAALTAYAASDSRGPALKAIAQTVGLSEKGLTHYFASRDDLLLAVLQERDRVDAVVFDESDREWLAHTVEKVASRNLTSPGLVKLYLDLAVAASDPAHVAHEFFVDRYAQLTTLLSGLLVARGRAAEDARWQAEALIAAADGLQVQWLLNPRLDISSAAVNVARLIESGGSARP